MSDTAPPGRPWALWALGAVAALAFAAMLFVSYRVFRQYPYGMDEYNHLYQAQLFAQGRRYLTAPAAARPLAEMYMVLTPEGKLFSKYPPGFPLVLALGVRLGVAAAVNPLLSLATLVLLFLLLRRAAGDGPAVVATALLAATPYFIAYGSSYWSHPLALFLTTLEWFTLQSAMEQWSARKGVAAGFILGVLAWVRPVDALALAFPVAITLHRKAARFPSAGRRLLVHGLWIAPFAGLVLLEMFYNRSLTGRFSVSLYPVWHREFVVIDDAAHGFWDNARRIGESFLLRARKFLWPNLTRGFNLPLHGLPLFALCSLFVCPRRYRFPLLAHATAILLLYNFHPSRGWPVYGARYYYPVVAPVALLAAFGLRTLAPFAGPALAAVGIAVLLSVKVWSTSARIKAYGERFEVVFRIKEDVESRCPAGSLVVIPNPQSWRVPEPEFIHLSDLRRNPFLSGPRLYVRSLRDARALGLLYPRYDRVCLYAWDGFAEGPTQVFDRRAFLFSAVSSSAPEPPDEQ